MKTLLHKGSFLLKNSFVQKGSVLWESKKKDIKSLNLVRVRGNRNCKKNIKNQPRVRVRGNSDCLKKDNNNNKTKKVTDQE